MDPQTGELLGIVSKLGFDPNVWSGYLTSKMKQEIDNNPFKPMLDKSVKSYFPGSIYKVVTALAAMEEGVLDPELPIDSPGSYEYGNRIFHCHKLSGHGRVDLNGAMAASADVYFYKLGEKLGIDTLSVYGQQFGFGRHTLNLNGESAGVVPTRQYHNERGGFQHGLSLSSAIGQGAVRTSPLQMAVAFSALANHGLVYRPHLLLKSTTLQGELQKKWDPEISHRIPAKPESIGQIRRSLERAVNDPKRATGYRAAVPMGRVAGKTGTAQVKTIIRDKSKQKAQQWKDQDHAWFAAFAPYEAPKVTVVVFLEHGGSGGKNAAPIVRTILERYHHEIEPIFDAQAQYKFPTSYRTQ
jgi:penicillin-binding protein 2